MERLNRNWFVSGASGGINLYMKMEDQKLEKSLEENDSSKKKLIGIAEGTARKMQLFCFLKDIPMSYFATKVIEKELKQYESLIENIKKLKFDYKD